MKAEAEAASFDAEASDNVDSKKSWRQRRLQDLSQDMGHWAADTSTTSDAGRSLSGGRGIDSQRRLRQLVHDQGLELRRLTEIVAKLESQSSAKEDAAKEDAAKETGGDDDGLLEYTLTESLWEAPLVMFALPVGLAGAVFAWLLLLFNIFLQTVLVYIIGTLLTKEVVTEEIVAEYAAWRRNSAHDVRYMEELTETSMAALVCSGSGKLVQSAVQAQAHEELLGYLGSDNDGHSFGPGAFMCLIALLVWSLTCTQDITRAVQLVMTVLILPTSRSNYVKREEGGFAIEGLSCVCKVSFCLVQFVRIVLAVLLGCAGSIYLIRTLSIPDLLLNMVALEFVLQLDEMLFAACAPFRLKVLLGQVQPLPCSMRSSWRGLDLYAVFCVTLTMVSTFLYTDFVLYPQQGVLAAARDALCAGNLDFVFSRTPGAGDVAWTESKPVDDEDDEATSGLASFIEAVVSSWLGPWLANLFRTVSDDDKVWRPWPVHVAEDPSSFAEAALDGILQGYTDASFRERGLGSHCVADEPQVMCFQGALYYFFEGVSAIPEELPCQAVPTECPACCPYDQCIIAMHEGRLPCDTGGVGCTVADTSDAFCSDTPRHCYEEGVWNHERSNVNCDDWYHCCPGNVSAQPPTPPPDPPMASAHWWTARIQAAQAAGAVAANAGVHNEQFDACCISRQLHVASVNTGAFSLYTRGLETISDAANFMNPVCTDILFEPSAPDVLASATSSMHGAVRIVLDLRRGGPRSNVMRGAVGDSFDSESCGGSCPWTRPMCLNGACVVPTCELLQPFCHAATTSGARARQNCPVTCGCSQPASPLALSGPSNGCPQMCMYSDDFNSQLHDMPCADMDPRVSATNYSSAFASYLNNAFNASYSWPPTVRGVAREIILAVNASGCAALGSSFHGSPPGYLDQTSITTDACTLPSDGTGFIPMRSMAVFCPVTCGCRFESSSLDRMFHLRWNCPTQCFSHSPLSGSSYAYGGGNSGGGYSGPAICADNSDLLPGMAHTCATAGIMCFDDSEPQIMAMVQMYCPQTCGLCSSNSGGFGGPYYYGGGNSGGGYSGGEFAPPSPPSLDSCSCPTAWIGDGYCDVWGTWDCNTLECNFDGGDCNADTILPSPSPEPEPSPSSEPEPSPSPEVGIAESGSGEIVFSYDR